MTNTTTISQTDSVQKLALVLGATGGVGSAMAAKLSSRGYQVRAMHRDAGAQAKKMPQYEWVNGDAMARADVLAAAKGVELIVHAVNPPGYRNWGTLVLPMIENTIVAAKASGARILMPGTVYNFGPETFANVTEDSPQRPQSFKGKIRVQLEERLEAATHEGTQVILVRTGDYFGPGAESSWFSQVMIKPGAPVTKITSPSDPGVGHQWAYLPDVAETMMQLVERSEDLPTFARFHMEGVWDADGMQLSESIRRVTGRPSLRTRRFPWWLLYLGAPFIAFFRELLEMRYLWRQPLHMRNDKLVAFLGAEPHTPLDQAMRETLRGLGCLEASASSDPVTAAKGKGRAAVTA
ncbi:nucleoside-diphosphate-sugar epimerase [Hoeflea halophila]|uniref:Nucleoside-diphosphate-sugar epimerase n=1 Tax=Hoeflea halophila TaxID=714899 RepID=A0A286I2U6_9HYPH|nr:NAD-dependent epimerase/dehydratase family protein [Hoeflea halophila]SOE13729.1 nucleoside-diphosphate-sugar epimerase [Hoeflea halophila]